jgi:hypothetical protein
MRDGSVPRRLRELGASADRKSGARGPGNGAISGRQGHVGTERVLYLAGPEVLEAGVSRMVLLEERRELRARAQRLEVGVLYPRVLEV